VEEPVGVIWQVFFLLPDLIIDIILINSIKI
jgi:hypothetical protein